MKVKITEDKLHGVCQDSKEQYEIHHFGMKGEDLTGLASIASKSSWFEKDNPQFTPGTIQEAVLLENGRIEIIKSN